MQPVDTLPSLRDSIDNGLSSHSWDSHLIHIPGYQLSSLRDWNVLPIGDTLVSVTHHDGFHLYT